MSAQCKRNFRINLYYPYFELLHTTKAAYLARQACEFINTTCSIIINISLKTGGATMSICLVYSCHYRSPSQMQDELETLKKKFEVTLDKIHENTLMTAVPGNFNAKSKNWCNADITSLEGFIE